MQAEALALWERLWNKVSFLDGATTDHAHDFERRLVMGKFAATIETVAGTSNPVEMSASVGWASSAAYQEYDFDETFRTPVSKHFLSLRERGWIDRETREVWSDDEVIDALLSLLGEWVRTDGRFSD